MRNLTKSAPGAFAGYEASGRGLRRRLPLREDAREGVKWEFGRKPEIPRIAKSR
jgi:hypothetical protein